MSEFLHRLPEFLGNHPFLAFAFFGVLIALAASEVQRLTRGFAALTPAALTRLINQENALVVDVSPAQDFEKGHIPGSKSIPLAQFDPQHKDLAKARELPVALVCRSGRTAQQAARTLKQAGFPRVFLLDGGIAGWTTAQMPLVKGRA